LKSQFPEERAKWDETNKQNMPEDKSLRKHNSATARRARKISGQRHFTHGGEVRRHVHDKATVKITASSLYRYGGPRRNATGLGDRDSWFLSENEPGQCICLNFKTVRIERTHYTIQVHVFNNLESWAIEVSDGGTSSKEIERPQRQVRCKHVCGLAVRRTNAGQEELPRKAFNERVRGGQFNVIN
jgi:hypothetical protein